MPAPALASRRGREHVKKTAFVTQYGRNQYTKLLFVPARACESHLNKSSDYYKEAAMTQMLKGCYLFSELIDYLGMWLLLKNQNVKGLRQKKSSYYAVQKNEMQMRSV